jgi:V/A-type H+-transporting ATPase subunit K
MRVGTIFLIGGTAVVGLLSVVMSIVLFAPDAALAVEAQPGGGVDPGVVQWALLAAALAAGLATLGAGYAVAVVGSAAVGAITEKPERLGRVLILVGLAEGIAIYGLIVAILILDRAG